MRKYKINNSYTVYVPNASDETDGGVLFNKKLPPLEWKEGAKVYNYFYGKGKITSIDDGNITVHFYGVSRSTVGRKEKHRNKSFIITYSKEDAYKDLRLIRK